MADKSLTVDGNWTTKTAPVAADRLPLINSEATPNTLQDVELSNLHKALTQATDTQAGTVELATSAEVITGTDTARAITPAGLQTLTSSATRDGIVELATDAEAITGTDTERALTPANLRAVLATLPRGTVFNLRLSVTVSSNDLVVALKTHAGTDPSATDPGYIKIGNTVRPVQVATSFTLADGTNWFNSGSAELGTKEIDYFVYVVWDSDSAIVALSASRIPYGNLVSDFSGTTTNEKHLVNHANFTSTDEVEVIGRFAATLSLSGTSHVWTVPTFTAANLIQYPIYETRWLAWTADFPTSTAMTVADEVIATAKYKISSQVLRYQIRLTGFTIGGTPNAIIINTLPFDAVNDVQVTGAMLWVDNAGGGFGGNRINATTPDQLYWLKDGLAAWAAGAGTALNGSGWYEI